MYKIEQFQELNKPEKMIITQHSRKRFAERDIRVADICLAIAAGEIIEDYSEDYPFPSCLILGSSGERKLHIVASIDEGFIYLITAYEPDPERWDSEFKKRKEDS